jgi:hypothetical protein
MQIGSPSKFEATKITRQTLVMNLSKLLYSFGLRKKIIASVKNEGTNWNAMISTNVCCEL